jgi:hypothetical protein
LPQFLLRSWLPAFNIITPSDCCDHSQIRFVLCPEKCGLTPLFR